MISDVGIVTAVHCHCGGVTKASFHADAIHCCRLAAARERADEDAAATAAAAAAIDHHASEATIVTVAHLRPQKVALSRRKQQKEKKD